MNFLSNNQKGTLYAIISGLCYGFLGYFGMNIINSGLSVYDMLFWRFLITTIIMIIIFIPQYKMILQKYKEGITIIVYGMTFYAISAIVYFIASIYIGSGLAMVIFFIYPAMVMLLNVILYKAKIGRIYYLAFSVVILGLILMVDVSEFKFNFLGIILSILSAIFYALYMLASKRMEISPIFSTLMLSIGCTITCFICSYIDSRLHVPDKLDMWINLICMAVFCTTIPILFLLEGLKYISSEKASILSVLEPLFVFIFGIILLGEKINNTQILGTIILLSGALMTLLPKKSEQ